MTDLIRSACLTGYVEVARSVGLDPWRMLDAVGIDRRCLDDPDIRIPAGALRRLLEASAMAAKVEAFGLRLAADRELSNLGPIALVVREEPTVRRAIESLSRYVRLHNDSLRLHMEEVHEIAFISPVIMVRRPVPMRQAVELTVGVLYRILRLFLGATWKPRVCFTHAAPKNLEMHRRVFNTRVEFGSDLNGIICDARDLDAPLPASDPVMARYARQYLESMLSRPHLTTRDKVRELVWMLLPSGQCSIERVAEHLAIDRRTVHRRLARRGESFSSIVDAVRTEMVTRYLENPDRSLHAIAEMLGFSAQSAFSRWFRDRFGMSASAWRLAGGVRRVVQ